MKRLVVGLAIVAGLSVAALFTASTGRSAASHTAPPFGMRCGTPGQSYLCTDVENGTSIQAFGQYVGHDEPSLLFYSNAAGSGNNNYWNMTLPKQPTTFPSQAGAGSPSMDFELHPAFWFGMAMCDNTGYPNYTQAPCTPDSDSNIFDGTNPSAPDFISHHPGAAYMEFQLYPPGWVPWTQAISCDPTKWCAAMLIWSFIEQANPFQFSNPACAAITGPEPGNIQFLSLGTSGVNVNGPADFWDATAGSFTPNSGDLFMNSGDRLSIHMNDTPAGFKIQVNDLTSGQVGAALASASNGFAHAPYNPAAGTCTPTPYSFHPMYSTSSEHTRVVWAAHSYNVAYSDEIGHFELCDAITGPGGNCTGNEGGFDGAPEPHDGDDTGCWPAAMSYLVPITGCIGGNSGFDGASYNTVAWPGTGQPLNMTPQPVRFKSPYFGSSPITGQYQRAAFETDLIALENSAPPYGGAPFTCSTQSAGPQCQNPPSTDDSTASNIIQAFYPIFSTVHSTGWLGQCMWAEGGANQVGNINNFGGTSTAEYGPPLGFYYPLNGPSAGVRFRYENYRNIIGNPCKN